jgi:hypothetical protein
MNLRFWKRKPPILDEQEFWRTVVLTADQLDSFKKSPVYDWLMETVVRNVVICVSKGDSAGANALLYLTEQIDSAIDARSQAQERLEAILEEQRQARSESQTRLDTGPDSRIPPQIV